MKQGLRALLSGCVLVLVSSCGAVTYEPVATTPASQVATRINGYELKDMSYDRLNVFCAGPTKVYAIRGSREVSIQVFENHPDCVGK